MSGVTVPKTISVNQNNPIRSPRKRRKDLTKSPRKTSTERKEEHRIKELRERETQRQKEEETRKEHLKYVKFP